MNAFVASCIALLVACGSLHASTRNSATYSFSAETVGTGGVGAAQSAGGTYSLAGSALGETAVAGPAVPLASASYTARPGFVGTIYNVQSLAVAAHPTTVNEGGPTTQLSAAPLLDDNTQLTALPPTAVAWSIVTGPVASISPAGVATAANVYQNTTAAVGATSQGYTGRGTFTVLNVGTDDYGSYAGDGIDDAWQVQYFGLNNPLAGPGVDADGTGQSNLFKYLAGLNPLDPTSVFSIRAQLHPGQSNSMDVIFGPLLPTASGRTYTVQFKSDLANPNSAWTTLTGTTQVDNGTTRTVTDPNAASSGRRLYRVLITQP